MGIFPEMLVCGDITVTTLCTKLTCRHAVDQIGTLWLHSTWQQLLYSCSKYFGAKRCFLLNNVYQSAEVEAILSHWPFCLQRHATN